MSEPAREQPPPHAEMVNAPGTPPTPGMPFAGSSPEAFEAARKLIASRPETAGTVGVALSIGGNPMVDKVTAEHIATSLELAKSREMHEYELRKQAADHDHERSGSDRRFEVFVIALLAGILLILVVVFRDKPAVLTPLITAVASGFAGFLGGNGYGRSRAAKDK